MQEILPEKVSLEEDLPILKLPENWWHANNTYSYYNYFPTKNSNPEVQLFQISNSTKRKVQDKEIITKEMQTVNDWNYSKGDYFIKNGKFPPKNNQDFNNLILNNFLYIAIVISVLITLLFLSVISNL